MTEDGAGEFLEGVEGADKLVEKGIDSPQKLAEAYRQLETELQSRPKPPGENATSDDLRKFRERIGLINPEAPGYALPEDLPEVGRERVSELTQLIPEGSMTDSEYRDWAHKLASREASTRQEAITQAREAMLKQAEQSREEHGTDAIAATEQFMADQFGEDPDLLKSMMLQAKHPKVVEAFSTLVEAMKERPLPQHDENLKAPANKLTIPQLGHELAQIQKIVEAPDFNPADPANAAVSEKADKLYRIMHDGGFASPQQMIKHRS